MSAQSEAKVCFETLKSALENSGWKYDVKDEFLLLTGAKGDNMPIQLFIGVDPEKPTIFIHSPMPYKVDEDKIDLMARAVCEVNFTMLVGSFDLDSKNGRIVFKVTLPCMECLVSEAVCKYLIFLTCHMADMFNLKFLNLCKGEITFDKFMEEIREA